MSQIIGLTGGIASGKSAVTAYLREQGYVVIDADEVVHELQAKGGRLYQVLVDWLGQDILKADGELNRPVLAEIIFANPDNRAKSAELQNGIIREELAKRRDEVAQTERLFFMDIPLLYELQFDGWFDAVWLVYVDRKTQLERLMARNGYTALEAQQRLASQLSLDEKKEMADLVIDNNGYLEETYAQLEAALKEW
ncbi:dephospho-CoA kinase [Streptococcus moroccensis]|uniref:Dephospho-CoA kinase n=1 Tax=Streptococcus moroccensis TaxID=1451356 RepID=A0ABT9YPC9_9STRE|nr:dephospho-CoA kinase [Streptococcus moroccensis]MDQ0221848.1 dephospho-CoA kinase [Streptococcus moroccensis]